MPATKRLNPGVRPVWAPVETGIGISRIHPTPGWVIIKEAFLDNVTDGGIIVVKPYISNTVFGEVVAVNVLDTKETQVLPGDKIVFREYSGGRWSFQGEKVLIAPLDSILAWYEA